MKSYDFEYDGKKLSDFGFMICSFDSTDVSTISNGAELQLSTVSVLNGEKKEKVSSSYEDCITATFQICKNVCKNETLDITVEELREISSWLVRKSYHKFKLLQPQYENLYFESTFNISKMELDGKIIGLELSMTTNRPFGLIEEQNITLEITNIEENQIINNLSDEEGFIYPLTKIIPSTDGKLVITNLSENRRTVIENCVQGETITLDYPIISTTNINHNIQNDFNWDFFRISKSYGNGENEIQVSIPCIINIKYSPIAKIGI